jgi:hypothetical protein
MKNCTTLLFLFVTVCSNHCFGQTHVQTTTKYQPTTATSIAVSFASASTTGNLIVVHIDWDKQSIHVNTVTDNKGNTYHNINGPTNWNGVNYRAELWYAYNITGGAILTVTANLTGTGPTSFSQIYVSEYSGIVTSNPLDQNSVNIGNTVAVSSGAKTTTSTNELIYGVSIGASGLLTTGAGFNTRSSANQNIVEDKNVSPIGSYSANFTSASGNWIAQMATFVSSNIILPVNLLSFTGQCENNNIVLNWSTGSETNNKYFTVERSEDGDNWRAIGTVKSAGNSSITQNYSFTTDKSNGEISYFRLKQTNLDGEFKYFNVIQVSNCNSYISTVSIYPNPSNGQSLHGVINLKANESYSIEVSDNTGKIVSRFVSTQPQFSINFSRVLQPGVYYARIYSSNFSKAICFLVAR